MLQTSPQEASQFFEGSTIRVDFADFVEVKMWKFSLSDKVLEVTLIQMSKKTAGDFFKRYYLTSIFLMCFNSTNSFYCLLNESLCSCLSQIEKENRDRKTYQISLLYKN